MYMRDFLLRLIVHMAALGVTAAILPGISIGDNSVWTLLLVALIFGLINAIFKPFLIIMSCPLIILTLGMFTLVINGLLLLLTDAIAGSYFNVDGFWWAVLGGLVVSIVSGIAEGLLGLHTGDEADEDVVVISQ